MRLVERSGVPLWQSAVLAGVPGVWHAFTTRLGGTSAGPFASLNLSMRVGDDPAAVRANRALVARAAGIDPLLLRLQAQVHGVTVVDLGDSLPEETLVGDAFIATAPGMPAIVGIADCAPVLLASQDGRVVAAVHAGWRGAASGVVPAAIRTLRERHDVPPEALRAAIGSAIGPCCYEVGEDVAAGFSAEMVHRRGGKLHLDLPGAVARQLEEAGIPPPHIDSTSLCTCCHEGLCFSHRGSGGQTGRMMAAIVRSIC